MKVKVKLKLKEFLKFILESKFQKLMRNINVTHEEKEVKAETKKLEDQSFVLFSQYCQKHEFPIPIEQYLEDAKNELKAYVLASKYEVALLELLSRITLTPEEELKLILTQNEFWIASYVNPKGILKKRLAPEAEKMYIRNKIKSNVDEGYETIKTYINNYKRNMVSLDMLENISENINEVSKYLLKTAEFNEAEENELIEKTDEKVLEIILEFKELHFLSSQTKLLDRNLSLLGKYRQTHIVQSSVNKEYINRCTLTKK